MNFSLQYGYIFKKKVDEKLENFKKGMLFEFNANFLDLKV